MGEAARRCCKVFLNTISASSSGVRITTSFGDVFHSHRQLVDAKGFEFNQNAYRTMDAWYGTQDIDLAEYINNCRTLVSAHRVLRECGKLILTVPNQARASVRQREISPVTQMIVD
jgi:hypothetical protein